MPDFRETKNIFIPGRMSLSEIGRLLNESSKMKNTAEKIEFLSGCFLDVPYREFTLTGSDTDPESLIVNLQGVDCFTLLDYVEAMRNAVERQVVLRGIELQHLIACQYQFPHQIH